MSGTKKSISLWAIFATFVLILQAFASGAALYMLKRLDILPTKYFAAAAGGVAILFLITLLLMLRGVVRRIVGTILAIIVIAAGVIGAVAMDKMIYSMDTMTAFRNVEHVNICVYVDKDDPAESINDAENYLYGVTTAYDYENSQATIQEMEKSLGHTISVKEYDTVFGLLDALYAKEVQAIILNQAYEDIISGIENYATFTYDTKILHYLTLDLEVKPVDQVEEAETETTEVKKEFDITKDTFAVYLSGQDTRDMKLSRSQSDVNIIAVVNPVTRQVLFISTPRDYYLPISVGNGEYDKLTHCGLYGIQCSMDTLSELYDVDIRYYAQINFEGFKTLIDAIGGVEVYCDDEFCEKYDLDKGNNTLDGEMALRYVRERYAYADGDRTRGRHQMAVLKAIIQKVTRSATLITNYSAILDSLEGMFTTDVGRNEISAMLKMQFEDMSRAWTIVPISVTGTDSTSEECYSWVGQELYVMEPDMSSVEDVKNEIQKVLNGEKLR